MDTLAAMRTFVAIVDGGSLTAAAAALDRSQPAVVRSLAALEDHLGTRLLQRTTRRMSLTPEGSDYLQRCRQILNDVDEAERAARQDDDEPHGPVRITAPVQFGQMHVAPLLTRFIEDHPRITVDLLLLDRNVNLIDEGVDLALRIGPLPDSGLIALPVGEVRRVVCAAPSLLDRTGVPHLPQQLAELPCIRVRNLARAGTWLFRDGSDDIGVKVDGRFSCNQIAAAIDACVDGAGFGQFLSYQVQDQLRDGRLKRVLSEYEAPPLPVNVVYSDSRFATMRQRVVTRFLREQLRERVFRADR
ncbi:MAG: LysR family transcriptional regulator [Woeseiaceae bacterium]|nr:LysR family transcriptional regulator [Woeseiaceae bacterium]